MPDSRDSQGDASTELGMSSDVPSNPGGDLAHGQSGDSRPRPFGPPNCPDLRTTRFEEQGKLLHRWVWEPSAQRWTHRGTSNGAEREAARVEYEAYLREHPITDEELAYAAQLAKEIGK